LFVIVCIVVYETNSYLRRWFFCWYISQVAIQESSIPSREHFGAKLSAAAEVKTARVSLMKIVVASRWNLVPISTPQLPWKRH